MFASRVARPPRFIPIPAMSWVSDFDAISRSGSMTRLTLLRHKFLGR